MVEEEEEKNCRSGRKKGSTVVRGREGEKRGEMPIVASVITSPRPPVLCLEADETWMGRRVDMKEKMSGGDA